MFVGIFCTAFKYLDSLSAYTSRCRRRHRRLRRALGPDMPPNDQGGGRSEVVQLPVEQRGAEVDSIPSSLSTRGRTEKIPHFCLRDALTAGRLCRKGIHILLFLCYLIRPVALIYENSILNIALYVNCMVSNFLLANPL